MEGSQAAIAANAVGCYDILNKKYAKRAHTIVTLWRHIHFINFVLFFRFARGLR